MDTEITQFELLLEKKLQWKLLGEFFGNISQCLQQEVTQMRMLLGVIHQTSTIYVPTFAV